MRTEEKLQEVCDHLRAQYGDVHRSCRMAGISPDFLFNWMRDDKVAAEAVEEAKRVGYLGIESAIIDRAIHGVEKQIFYKGEVCGYETVYSDSLLSKLADARLEGFRKGDDKGNTFNGPTQINIMPRANSYDEWLAMKDATLARRANEAALPKPSVPLVLQGSFVERPLAGLEGLL